MKKIKREISLKELKDTVIFDRKQYHSLIYELICAEEKLNDIRRIIYGYREHELNEAELIEKIKSKFIF